MTDAPDLAALLCSRLCHDLISPVGAVGNGIELLRADPSIPQDELDLIEESAGLAQAALSFFRIAFGIAAPDALMGPNELGRIAAAQYRLGRVKLDWRVTDDLPRPLAKALYLALMAGAGALPLGGAVTLSAEAHPMRFTVTAEGRRAGMGPEAAAVLRGDPGAPASAREAHLLLLRELMKDLSLSIEMESAEERFRLSAA